MRFWRLEKPHYDDYGAIFVNGVLEHPFGLPGVRCHLCGATWSGTRVLPVDLPPSFRSRTEFCEGSPIDAVSHERLRSELLSALRQAGSPVDGLRPGDDFQPCYLDIPSFPEFDFLWSSLASVVVSERIRTAFASAGIDGVAFAPVEFRKVGRASASMPAPIPMSGEPEDLLLDLPDARTADRHTSYYEMVVTAESALPRGVSADNTCACGRLQYDNESRELIMRDDMWQGADVFLLATTLWIVVTDRVRSLITELEATNVEFRLLAE
jgi:hypothetical protein